MKIIHIASFQGNLGDIINHKAFYNYLRQEISEEIIINQVEIRLFYKNVAEKEFDSIFLEEVNTYDFMIIGGGGFFDVNWEYSATAVTINMSQEFIEGIKIPVLVNAIGYHEYTQEEELYQRFERFIGQIVKKKNFMVRFRNDGSKQRFFNRYQKDYGILPVPDNGFLIQSEKRDTEFTNKRIGVMVTNDLLDFQYNRQPVTDINDKIINCIRELLSYGDSIVFFLHTPQDIYTVCKILNKIGELYCRSQIIVSPYYAVSPAGIDCIMPYYDMCEAIISMRFHSSILSIVRHIPVIGLAGHKQIEGLFYEIGLEKQLVIINNKDFDKELLEHLQKVRENREEIIKQQDKVLDKIKKESKQYFSDIVSFFKQNIRKR